LTSITSVRFQYGTNLSETYYGNGGNGGQGGGSRVPYPSSLALLGFGALGAVLVARRRRLAVSRVRR
jgi:PEP-CTERM motif